LLKIQLMAGRKVPSQLSLLLELHYVPVVPLAERRGHSALSLGGLPNIVLQAEDLRWSLFYHAVLENPDFPKLPLWNMDSVVQRGRLDFVSQLCEDDSPDFFAHAIFVEKILDKLEYYGMSLFTKDVMAIQEKSLSHYENELTIETMAAQDDEGNRLLWSKIEHILPTFKRLEKENKVLPYIKLEVLDAAEFLEAPDIMCSIILWRAMRKMICKAKTTDLRLPSTSLLEDSQELSHSALTITHIMRNVCRTTKLFLTKCGRNWKNQSAIPAMVSGARGWPAVYVTSSHVLRKYEDVMSPPTYIRAVAKLHVTTTSREAQCQLCSILTRLQTERPERKTSTILQRTAGLHTLFSPYVPSGYLPTCRPDIYTFTPNQVGVAPRKTCVRIAVSSNFVFVGEVGFCIFSELSARNMTVTVYIVNFYNHDQHYECTAQDPEQCLRLSVSIFQ
jgi:hypothetical protein